MDILGRLSHQERRVRRDDIDDDAMDFVDDAFVEDDTGCENPFIAVQKGSRRNVSSRKMKTGSARALKDAEDRFDKLCLEGVELSCAPGSRYGAAKKKRQRIISSDSGIFDSILSRLEEMVRLNMQREDEHVFEEVDGLARHCLKRHIEGYDHVIPTGLVFGGGVNSADHSRLFPAMKSFLEGKNCRVALLSPNAFIGRTIGFTLEKIMDQMKNHDQEAHHTGLESECFEMEDLVDWYESHVAASSKGDLQPLIIIVESVETTPSEMLQDLIHVLHESYPFLPHLLLLGLTTTSETLADALPHSMVDRYLCCYKFEMAPSMLQLDSFVEMMLLKSWNGCFIDPKAFNHLLDTFFLHHFTVSAIFSGMKLALTEHLATHPCLLLLEKSFGGREDFRKFLEILSVEDLDTILSFVESGKKCSRKGQGKASSKEQSVEHLFNEYCAFRQGWQSWRFALRLLTASGKAMDPSTTFTAWKIYERVAKPDFKESVLPSLVATINQRIQVLDPNKVLGLHHAIEQIFKLEYKDSEWISESAEILIDDLNSLIREWPTRANHIDQADTESEPKVTTQDHTISHEKGPMPQQLVRVPKGNGKANRRQAIRSLSTSRPPTNDDTTEGNSKGLASEWAKIFCSFILREMETSPWTYPAAKLFACRLEPVHDNLLASTRNNIHKALIHPKTYLPSNNNNDSIVKKKNIGIDASDEDTCVAYSLFDQDASCSNLVDWYLSFESILSNADLGNKTKGSQESQEQKRVERIARFSQSLQDLQYIGMIQSSRKKNGDHAQRCVFQPEVNIF